MRTIASKAHTASVVALFLHLSSCTRPNVAREMGDRGTPTRCDRTSAMRSELPVHESPAHSRANFQSLDL